MKKAKGEEVLQLVVANWCAPLARKAEAG